MPQQSNVTLTANADGTGNLQVGPSGFPNVNFFGQSSTPQQLAAQIGLAFRIGGFTQPGAQTFLSYVNNTLGGIKLCDGTYFLTEINHNADGSYTIGWALTPTAPTLATLTAQLPDFSTDSLDPSVVIGSVMAALRLGNFASLTPAAVAAINARQFWF